MVEIGDLLEFARSRRTSRSYVDKEVPREYVEQILEVARWAPSGGNTQPWEFVVVTDPDVRRQIVEIYVRQSELSKEMEVAVRGERGRGLGAVGFRNAPVFIIVLGDRRVNESFPILTQLDMAESHFVTGLASAVLLIHQAAASLGLASQWVSSLSSPWAATMLKSLLDIPYDRKVYNMIPLGYAAKPPRATPRREAAAFTHWERYDPSKTRTAEDIQRFLATQTRLGNYGAGTAENQDGQR